MLNFCSLYSGSSGNSLFVQNENTNILIDAGESAKKIVNALSSINVPIEKIDAIVVTHEHLDHVKSIGTLSSKYNIPVYATEKTWSAMPVQSAKIDKKLQRLFSSSIDFTVGDLQLHPFSIPHDAADPCGFNIKSENKVKGKVENFFIEAKGKFKSGLNKFKVNLNDKEHVKSRKKIEILQVLLTIILLPFAFAIVCSTIGVGIGLIGSLIALVIGTPFAISLTNVMPEVKTLIIFLFIAYIGFEILIWQLFIAVVRLEKKAFKIYITWIKTNQW